MKITIEIPDMYVKTLATWASIGRTLSTASSGCCAASSGEPINEQDREKYGHCSDEIDEIKPALEVLHQAAQHEIWQIQRGQKAS